MAVPTQLSDLSATAASNSPAGTDTVGTTMDDFIRAHASIIARISAGTDALATPAIGAATGTSLVLSGLATVNGAFTSLGLDDNATAKALTLSGSGANSVTIANSATNPTIGTSAGNLGISSSVVLTDGFIYGWGAAPTAWIAGTSASNVIGLYTNSVEQVRILNVVGATKRLGLYGGAAGNAGVNVSSGSLELGSPVVLVSQTVDTTVGAAGGASALPATPLGYLTTSINGTACKVPYYPV